MAFFHVFKMKSVATELAVTVLAWLGSMAIIGMLSANVVYVTRLAEATWPPDAPIQTSTLSIYRRVNAWLLVLPILIWCVAVGNITSYLSLKKAAKKAATSLATTQDQVEKRSMVYGALFTLVGLIFCAVFALDAIVLTQVGSVPLPSDSPVSADALASITTANFYFLVFPGLLTLLGLVLVGTTAHKRHERADAADAARRQSLSTLAR